MDKMKVLLGLAAGGYWVYLVQTRKVNLKPWEYWAGLGVGAYWAWLAYSSPAEAKKVQHVEQAPQPQPQPQPKPPAPVSPQPTTPPVSQEEHTYWPGVGPPPNEQDWLNEKGEEEQLRIPPGFGELPAIEEWELPER